MSVRAPPRHTRARQCSGGVDAVDGNVRRLIVDRQRNFRAAQHDGLRTLIQQMPRGGRGEGVRLRELVAFDAFDGGQHQGFLIVCAAD